MDSKGINALDLRYIVEELKERLEGGFIRKIYQTPERSFLFEVYSGEKGVSHLFFNTKAVFLTKKIETPQTPPAFCMLLRKYLSGKIISDISQHKFDRILEIKTKENILIIELLHPGNVILCDKFRTIIQPLTFKKWKDRELKMKIPYTYPPAKSEPFGILFTDLFRQMQLEEKKIVSFIAADLGFGSLYANHLCEAAGISPETSTREITEKMFLPLYTEIEGIKNKSIEAQSYEQYATPFPLAQLGRGRSESDFSSALSHLYSRRLKTEDKKESIEKQNERIKTMQKEAKEKWIKKGAETREKANIIYTHFATIDACIGAFKDLRERNIEWTAIKDAFKEKLKEQLVSLDPKTAQMVLKLDGQEVTIDLKQSAQENAVNYFTTAKKAKKKTQRLEEALKTETLKEKPLKKSDKNKKQWYEKFKWFFTSDGFLVIAGKDAQTNENVVKKHAGPNDLIFHADIAGAAFVVIRSEGKDITQKAMQEAAQFSAVQSKAWQKGLGTIDVYAVKKDQLSKRPASGEFVGKGSFIVSGERTWFKSTELQFAIGLEKNIVISGPLRRFEGCKTYATIIPGNISAHKLAPKIKELLEKNSEKESLSSEQLHEIERRVPHGKAELRK